MRKNKNDIRHLIRNISYSCWNHQLFRNVPTSLQIIQKKKCQRHFNNNLFIPFCSRNNMGSLWIPDCLHNPRWFIERLALDLHP